MSFRFVGLDPTPFQRLHALDDAALSASGGARVPVRERYVAPCRITLDDAEIGETVLLLSYDHQPAMTPYRQQGPIFVRESAARWTTPETIPPALARRTLSLRGFDRGHMMIEADLCEGAQADALIMRFFANPELSYIHAHYARRGCFAALVERC